MIRRFVFFVNAAYCYSIYRPLQEAIRQAGHEAAWFFVKGVEPHLMADEKLLESEQEVKAYAPDAMFGAGDWIPHYLPGLKVMVFHGLSINKRATDNNAHYKVRGWYDLYCTHAEEDTRIFSELAQKHQNFRVQRTGWPKLDTLFQYRDETLHNSESKTLFFASTFSPSITSAPYVAHVLKEISESQGWNVIATLHPLMAMDVVRQFESLRSDSFTFLSPEDDLYQAMAQADVMLCDTSSIMYEFMFLNKPVVTFNTKNPGNFVKDVQKVSEIFPAIKMVLDSGAEQLKSAQKICAELHSFSDGCSSERVIQAVIETLAMGREGLKPRSVSLLRKLKLRKRLGYWGC